MGEVAGAVIATSLVLVAVFVPVAFFPGTTGILFRQFALTIAFSISISAFNALTLTPALSAILLGREHGEKNWFFRQVDKVINGITEGYRRALRFFLRFRLIAAVLFFGALGLTYLVFQRVPKGFVPNEDQGYFIIAVQAPSGASLEYTKGIGQQVQHILQDIPEVRGIFAIAGFSFSGSASNQALIFVPLKPYSQRKGDAHAAEAIVNRIRGRLFGISGALVLPFLPPAVQGLGQFGGFAYELQDQGSHTLEELANVTQRPDPSRRRPQRPDRPLQHLHRQRSPVRGDHRSRKGEEPARSAAADYGRPGHLHGFGVRQRFRFQQPFLPGLRAGGPAVPRPGEGHQAVLCARRQRVDDSAGEPGLDQADHGAAGHQSLQPVPLGRN